MKKNIIPIVFTMYDIVEKCTMLDVFYKFFSFAKKYNMPMIVQEKFLKDPNEFKKENHSAVSEHWQDIQGYSIPSYKEIKNHEIYVITQEEENSIVNSFKNLDDACLNILSKRNKVFEDIIDKYFKQIEKKKKIDAVITWVNFPSLDYIAKKHNIKVINMELSPIRKPIFNERLGYFRFFSKYDNETLEKDYNVFLKENHYYFTRLELLCMLLSTENLENIKYLYSLPLYEVGYALGLADDKYEKIHSNFDFNKVNKILEKQYQINDVIIRPHPAIKKDFYKTIFKFDHSKNSFEWISKCRNIICNVSNVGYEAQLFNRSVTHISNGIATSFGKKFDLSYLNNEVIGIERLNFLTFYCYTPYDLMFDVNYIEWRLTELSVNEIYQKNLNEVLKNKNLDINKLKKLKYDDKIRYILKNVHNLDDNKINAILNYKNKNYGKLFTDKEIENNKLRDEINSIVNSKSWKVTAPLRKLSNFFGGEK